MEKIKITYEDILSLERHFIFIRKRSIIGNQPEQDEYDRIMQLGKDKTGENNGWIV